MIGKIILRKTVKKENIIELYEEIMSRSTEVNGMVFLSKSEFVEGKCYKLLREIRDILASEEFDDAECFWKIEKIVVAFEESGISAGGRHDFG